MRDRRLPPRGSVLRLGQTLPPLLRSLPAPLEHRRAPGAARRGGGRPSVPVRGAAGRAALPFAPGCRCLPACPPRAARPDVPPAARSARPPERPRGARLPRPGPPPLPAAISARRPLRAGSATESLRGVPGGNREQGAEPQPPLNAERVRAGKPRRARPRGAAGRLAWVWLPSRGASRGRGLLREKGESRQISVLPIYRNSRGQEDGNSNIADTRRETLKKGKQKPGGFLRMFLPEQRMFPCLHPTLAETFTLLLDTIHPYLKVSEQSIDFPSFVSVCLI